MKKMNFKLLTACTIVLMMVFASSCKKDTVTPPDYKPVLDKTFSYVLNGNTVSFSTTIPGNVWFTNNGTDYPAVDKKVDVLLPIKGTYKFVCSSLGSGVTLTSDTFSIVMAQTDVSVLNAGIWKALTGGATGSKHWVLDVFPVSTITIDDAGVSSTSVVNKSVYFHNALDFYGDATAGGAADNVWGPWGGTSIFDWGGKPEVGDIIFNGVAQSATLTLKGVAKAGTFTMKTYNRDPNFCTISAKNSTTKVEQSLWDNMLLGKYSYLKTLSPQMADISMSIGMRFPMDSGRIAEQQFLDEDLTNVTVMHATDSALVIRVKRSFEGADKHDSKCWLLYNYVVKEYNYVKARPTHHVNTTLTAAALVGTWKLAPVTGNWIGWSDDKELNKWIGASSEDSTFTSWAATDIAAKRTAAGKVTLTFNANNTCTIHDVVYGTAEVATDYTTTYTVTNGYITFGASVTINGFSGMITLSGIHMYGTTVAGSTTGFWIGQNNGTKEETTAIHILKQ